MPQQMETAAGSESHASAKQEDVPDTTGNSILMPQKGKGGGGAISSICPTPEGERGGEADDVGPIACDFKEPEGNEGVKVPVAAATAVPMKMDKQGPVTLDRKSLTPEIAVELATEFFQCPLCLDLSYQSAVTVCGHIFCVGCTQRAMNIAGSSECPSCKSRYDYLPHGCELIENLVLKLQPPEGMDPLLGVADLFSEDEKTAESSVNVSSEDMSCMMCKDLLYQSTVLHCGHVFCISCVPAGGETIECPDCRTVHPSDSLKPCRKLNQFIEKCFPNAYKSRKEKPRAFSGISSKREAMIHQKVLHTHVGVGCDSCGIYPIEGDRYLCRACENFDLCEQCAKISNPIQGRLGQHHLPGHDLELNNSFIFTEVSRVWRERDIEGHWDT